MKRKILVISILLLSVASYVISAEVTENKSPSNVDSMSIFCTPDLINLTTKLAGEYNKVNPDVKINVFVIDPLRSDFKKGSDFGIISHEYSDLTGTFESAWKLVIGRDIIVPVINSKNPFINEINQKGISSAEIAQLFVNTEKRVWGTLLENSNHDPVKFYLINNGSLKFDIANFLGTSKTLMDGILVENGKELVSAIQKDLYAIGFCKLIDVIDFTNHKIINNVGIMPIDRNGNGKIDYSEKIYGDLNLFNRGVWIGKYPKTLFSNIYTVSKAQPENENEIAFLKWVLTDGQQFINPNGYIDLSIGERRAKIDKLGPVKIEPVKSGNNVNLITVLLSLAILLAAGFIFVALVRTGKHKIETVIDVSPIFQPAFNENSVKLLKGLFFDKTHTWAFMEKDGNVKMGIDDFLQHVMGAITQIRMKNPGEKVKKGEPALSIIQKGKQLNINAPVSGIIKEQNQLLITNPSLINSSPYSDGWVYTIEPSNWLREIQFLLMTENYMRWIKNEFSRLKDFISVFIKPGTVEYAHVILHDGGELKDNLLSDLGPEVWEEFQTNFIDTSK